VEKNQGKLRKKLLILIKNIKMYVSEIKQIEFELTSRCNVKCPGCPRTIINNSLDNSLALNDINFDNLKKWLPSKKILQPKNIKFSGNLGDPMVHPNAYEIFEYIGNNYNCNLHIHTNGGMRDEEFWKDLGKLSAYGKTLKDYKNFALQMNLVLPFEVMVLL